MMKPREEEEPGIYLFQQNPGGGVEVEVEALTSSLPS